MYIEWFVCHIYTLFNTINQAYIHLAVAQLNTLCFYEMYIEFATICQHNLLRLITYLAHLLERPDSERIIYCKTIFEKILFMYIIAIQVNIEKILYDYH